MRTVAILCAAKKSDYRDIPGCEVYDEARDARTFAGGMPVVAHPPCRYWIGGLFGRQARKFATEEQIANERDLGIFCGRRVMECGGILEQPAKSRLWEAIELPRPGSKITYGSFSINIFQSWFGFPRPKATWLFFSKIDPEKIEFHFRLATNAVPKRTRGPNWYNRNHSSRSHTVPALAQWLVDLARTAQVTKPGRQPMKGEA